MMKTDRISYNDGIWGLGVYINLRKYRYVALQVGPFWIYLWAQKGIL
jgi:hypothetical protein